MKIVLGSKSPRRSLILKDMGYDFSVRVSDAEEIEIGDTPKEIVQNIARQKNLAIEISDDELLISADTIVVYDGKIYGKPKDKQDAYDMLKLFQDNTHIVYTAVCIRNKDLINEFVCESTVAFFPLTDKEIWDYIESGDPMDKAGAYGIQGPFHKHIKGYTGSYYNIMGLPKERLEEELKKVLNY